uniref:Lipocalin n=1 Tax=Rhipicephalus appendiculatus TaxID=34631 RepID=A0A131YSK6_RHIAP
MVNFMKDMALNNSNFLLVLGLLFASKFSEANQKTAPKNDIVKFLGANDLLWTHSTTLGQNLKCRVDLRLSLNDTSIIFQRGHYRPKSSAWFFRDHQGTFDYWLPKDKPVYNVMHISRVGERDQWKTEEALKYQSPDNSCGVFLTLKRGKSLDDFSVDLRVANSSVDKVSQDCLDKFNRIKRKKTSHEIYTPDCQKKVQDHPELFYAFRQ